MNGMPVVDFFSPNRRLHDWIYDIAVSICYDREYCYRVFAGAFQSIVVDVLDEGGTRDGGEYLLHGLKSGFDAVFTWHLLKRLNYAGCHETAIECVILDKYTGSVVEKHRGLFELSLGEQVPPDDDGRLPDGKEVIL